VGGRIYTLQFKNLFTGEILSDKIENTTGTPLGQMIIKPFILSKMNTLRSDKVLKHIMGTETAVDKLIYFEKMILMLLGKEKSKNIF
jgi:oligopeptidase B